jgi:hypothetical protein
MLASKSIYLNNSAVASLRRGRPNEALELLSTALADLKDDVSDSDASTETHSKRSSSSSSRDFNNEEDEYSSAMEINVEQDQPSVFSVPVRTSTCAQCDHSLVLNYSCALAIFDDVQDKELLIAVVLYNMALVHHCRAIERGISSLITTALNLYKIAASFIENARDIDSSNGLLLLALYNNMAQIHASQFSLEETRVCIDRVRMLLSAVSAESFIEEEDYHFFFVNTMLQVEDIALAPAA